MSSLSIEQEIKDIFPDVHVGLLTGTVSNTKFDKALWEEINLLSEKIHSDLSMESIRDLAPVKMGKTAYRQLGKDPNRYRISAEALLRRIVKGNSLHQIHTLVDVLNLVSIETGITIGGFDKEKVMGDVSLGIGRENEEFEAIGRGNLNIHRLPVYRDEKSAIGSPTSDCVRTMMTINTTDFLMIITGFYGPEGLDQCMDMLISLMEKYINGKNFVKRIV